MIKFPRDVDQMMGKIGVDTPVPYLVRLRQGAVRDFAADVHVIEFVVLRPEQASMSRRLSRYVNWAKAIVRN